MRNRWMWAYSSSILCWMLSHRLLIWPFLTSESVSLPHFCISVTLYASVCHSFVTSGKPYRHTATLRHPPLITAEYRSTEARPSQIILLDTMYPTALFFHLVVVSQWRLQFDLIGGCGVLLCRVLQARKRKSSTRQKTQDFLIPPCMGRGLRRNALLEEMSCSPGMAADNRSIWVMLTACLNRARFRSCVFRYPSEVYLDSSIRN